MQGCDNLRLLHGGTAAEAAVPASGERARSNRECPKGDDEGPEKTLNAYIRRRRPRTAQAQHEPRETLGFNARADTLPDKVALTS